MVTREQLHQLLDALPEDELATAARVLEALSGSEPRGTVDLNGIEAATGVTTEDALLTAAEVRRRFGPAAVVAGAPPITSIDDVCGDFWPEDESADAFDATIRRWRDEDRRA